jgi:purine nucleosidase
MKKILLDTDIGSDIDDAFTLAYLLSHPDCDLLGITTVSGDGDRRAMMASAMCKAAGKGNIPIYPGVEKPLLIPQKQPIAKQAEVLSKWEHEKNYPKGEAIEFMRQTIRKNPHEVTLLAIGPMTNIGLLFSIDPEIPSLLKELVLMCGVFTYGLKAYVCLSEWNARCDPHATAMMYSAPVKNIKSVGLDVTTQVTMKKSDIFARSKADVLKPVLDFCNVWADNESDAVSTFHDPLAAAVIFDDSICTFKRGNVSVEIESKRAEGLTYFDEDPNGRNEVALTVDSERFFEHYFSIVK